MSLRLRRAATAVAALMLPTLVVLAPPASAHGSHHGSHSTVIASGLNNPRQLSFAPDGDLYVAEAGTGGAGPCMAGPEGETCFGLSGSVTKVHRGTQSRVLTGLPSLASPEGGGAIGPADILVTGSRRFALSMGLGANPAVRAMLPAGGQKLDTIQTGRFGRGMLTLSDLGDYETTANPDKGEVDSNPVGLAAYKGGFLVADAGANAVNRVRPWGATSTVAVLPDTMVEAPGGGMMPMQAVPTSVAIGPDGAIYVSQLTGYPFPKGGSTIWRIGRHFSTPTLYASGLTNVTDLAFRGHQLYAVQLATNGLLTPGLPMGSLVKVAPGSTSPTVVVGDLPAPYGVAIRSGTAYVTTCAVCPGGGSVMSFRL